jgi:hypothetical protein
MKTTRLRFALPALLAGVAVAAPAQDAANIAMKANVAAQVTEARQANATAMQQYTWDQRTEMLEDAVVKDTRVQMVNWVNGQYQKSLVSNEGPSLPRFGLRKRIAEKKQKEMQDYLSGLKTLLDQYTMGTTQAVFDFMMKASVGAPDAQGLIAMSGGSVVSPGDSLTIWTNLASKKTQKIFVGTTYKGDPITLNATFATLSTGLNYMNYADIQIPAKQLEVQVSNFNYNRNN